MPPKWEVTYLGSGIQFYILTPLTEEACYPAVRNLRYSRRLSQSSLPYRGDSWSSVSNCRSFVQGVRCEKAGPNFSASTKRRVKTMSIAVAEEKKTKLNQLEQLKKFTKVVADTADFESIKEFKPQDATTNPSLVYAATQKQQYTHLLDEVLTDRKKSGLSGHEQIEDICDHLLVQFGTDILEIVPGRVSTETDARLSYDVEGSIKKART